MGAGAPRGQHAAAALLAAVPRGRGAAGCRSRFEIPPQGTNAVALNGVQLPDVCINDTGEHEVFIIGDWGGVLSGKPGRGPEPADHRNKGRLKRKFVLGLDDVAQQKVAAQMAERAKQFDPDYILNVGDNFYWGGVETTCCQTRSSTDDGHHNFSADQWSVIFEDMYTGPGLDGKQWLGVLGNHDYGGFIYSAGWDQTIMYSWKELPHGRPQRWVTPALYWRSSVHYWDFSVDYFFVDSNHVEAMEPFEMMGTNICSYAFNADGVSCAAEGGPKSLDDCPQWFSRLWKAQRGWLEEGLAASAADWQVVVTHFPPTYGTDEWNELATEYGIDLMVSGHMHSQLVYAADDDANMIAPTVWVVSGGGGGITSDYLPSLSDPDNQYGFMHMTMYKNELRIVNIDHNGVEGQSAVVQQRPCLSGRCKTTTETTTPATVRRGRRRRTETTTLVTTATDTATTTASATATPAGTEASLQAARAETDLDLVALSAAGSGLWVPLLCSVALLSVILLNVGPVALSSRPPKSEDVKTSGQDVLPASHPATPLASPRRGEDADSQGRDDHAHRPLLVDSCPRVV